MEKGPLHGSGTCVYPAAPLVTLITIIGYKGGTTRRQTQVKRFNHIREILKRRFPLTVRTTDHSFTQHTNTIYLLRNAGFGRTIDRLDAYFSHGNRPLFPCSHLPSSQTFPPSLFSTRGSPPGDFSNRTTPITRVITRSTSRND